jgi:hypothetical protein
MFYFLYFLVYPKHVLRHTTAAFFSSTTTRATETRLAGSLERLRLRLNPHQTGIKEMAPVKKKQKRSYFPTEKIEP